jgi:hypothetical protein
MIISRERLDGAMTPEQYIETMSENRELFESNLAAVRLTEEERAFFDALPARLEVLVLTEDWCGDSAANLPIVVGLARQTGKLNLRILRREGNDDIAGHYLLPDGRNHIPTFIVHNAQLNETGNLIERTSGITEKLDAFKSSWFAAHPELGDASTPISALAPEMKQQFRADQRAFRRTVRDQEQREIIAAFRTLAEQALAPASAHRG